MVSSLIVTRPFTDAILARLTANLEGVLVGDGEAPVPSDFPYAVLYPLLSPEITDDGGTLQDPNAHPILEYQITSVGTTREQAQWTADIMRVALFAEDIVVADRSLWHINIDVLGQVERDDDLEPPLFYVNEVYSIPSAAA